MTKRLILFFCYLFSASLIAQNPLRDKVTDNSVNISGEIMTPRAIDTQGKTTSRIQQDQTKALQLIERAIQVAGQNDPEKILNSYSFRTYNRSLLTADPDSISNKIDSVYVIKNGRSYFVYSDSTAYKLRSLLNNSHLYIAEISSQNTYIKGKGFQKEILASHMAGLKDPVYEAAALELQSFSASKRTYSLFGNEYVNPISLKALKIYNYQLTDSTENVGRKAYIIQFSPKVSDSDHPVPGGTLYLDAGSLALQKIKLQLDAAVKIEAVQEYEYFSSEDIWFPVSKKLTIAEAGNNKAIAFFGKTLRVPGTGIKPKKNEIHSAPFNAGEQMTLIVQENNYDIVLNHALPQLGNGLSVVINDKVANRNDAYWESVRNSEIDERELNTYTYVDSVSNAHNLNQKLKFVRKLGNGYLPVGFLDIDLKYLIKFNNYEGFRPGLGLTTNEKLSSTYKFTAFGIYGFGDRDFKYGTTAAMRLDRLTDSWITLGYKDDLTETGSSVFITDGRAFYVFEPRLFNLTLFHKSEDISFSLDHNISSKLKSRLQFSKSNIRPAFGYNYINKGTAYSAYKLGLITLALNWAPGNEYMLTPTEITALKKGFPQIAFQVTRGIDDFLDGDFNFTKFDLRLMYDRKFFGNDITSFLLRGGIAYGDIPLTHLYNSSPNNPNNEGVFNRFAVADWNSFETMYFNEFFSDKYISAQLRHQFANFNFSDNFNPYLVLATRFVIGNLSNKELHETEFVFKELNKGFIESGFELNNLFKGFGLSTFYRYGPNELPRFEQNLSFKFTFNFPLSF